MLIYQNGRVKTKVLRVGEVSIIHKNNGRIAFIEIIIYNHFVLSMSLFISLTFRLSNRVASSEKF